MLGLTKLFAKSKFVLRSSPNLFHRIQATQTKELQISSRCMMFTRLLRSYNKKAPSSLLSSDGSEALSDYPIPKLYRKESELNSMTKDLNQKEPLLASETKHKVDIPSNSSGHGGATLGNIFDLTPEQYAELSNPKPKQTYTSGRVSETEPLPSDFEADYEPKYINISEITELMVRQKMSAALKKSIELLKPHEEVIYGGFPHHDPSLHADLRYEIAEVHGLMAMMYTRLSQPEKSIECYQQAVKLCPKEEFWSELSAQLVGMERYEEAIQAADEAIKLNPLTCVEALISKASALLATGQFHRDIIPICNLALARDPYAIDALEIKAQALAQQENFNDAIRTLDRAISNDNEHWLLFKLKSDYLQALNLPQNAYDTIAKWLLEEHEHAEANEEAAKLAIQLENWEAVIKHLTLSLQENDSGYVDLANAYINLGHVQQAQDAIQQAEMREEKFSLNGQPIAISTLKRRLTLQIKSNQNVDTSK